VLGASCVHARGLNFNFHSRGAIKGMLRSSARPTCVVKIQFSRRAARREEGKKERVARGSINRRSVLGYAPTGRYQ
jgi:hypothetical protein